jgi:hypothetical protein
LIVAQLLADELVRRLGMRLRERHGHVDVGGARIERALEDAGDDPRVRGVQDGVGAIRSGHRGDVGGIGGVDPRGTELAVRPEAFDDVPCARLIDVGEHHLFVEVATRGDRCERGADPSRPDHQDPHSGGV